MSGSSLICHGWLVDIVSHPFPEEKRRKSRWSREEGRWEEVMMGGFCGWAVKKKVAATKTIEVK